MLNVVRSPCSPQNVVLHVRYTQISISVNILSSSTRQSTRVARLSETPRRHRQTRTPGGRCIAAKSAVRPVPLSLSGACFYVLANWVAQRCTQLPRHGAPGLVRVRVRVRVRARARARVRVRVRVRVKVRVRAAHVLAKSRLTAAAASVRPTEACSVLA